MKKFLVTIIAVFAFAVSFASDYNGKFNTKGITLEVKTQNGVVSGTILKEGTLYLFDGKNDEKGIAQIQVTTKEKFLVGSGTMQFDAEGSLTISFDKNANNASFPNKVTLTK